MIGIVRRRIPLLYLPRRGGEKRGGCGVPGRKHELFKPFKERVAR